MAKTINVKALRINTDLIYEDPWPLTEAPRKVGKGRETLRKYIKEGIVSPVTGDNIQMECCFLTARQIGTSCAAFRRFIEELNGIIPSKETTEQ